MWKPLPGNTAASALLIGQAGDRNPRAPWQAVPDSKWGEGPERDQEQKLQKGKGGEEGWVAAVGLTDSGPQL